MGKLKQGDNSISAAEWNRHVDAANRVLGQQALGSPADSLRLAYDTNRVTVKNTSGADRRRGEILEFTGSPLTDFSSGELWLNGGNPTQANGFGVLLNPLPANTFGNRDCQVAGSCLALVNITNTTHTHAAPANGNYVLQSGTRGPLRILFKPSGTGERTCAVLFEYEPPPVYWVGDGFLAGSQATNTTLALTTAGGFPGTTIIKNGITSGLDSAQVSQAGDAEFTVPNTAFYHFGFQCGVKNNINLSPGQELELSAYRVTAAGVETQTHWRPFATQALETNQSGTIINPSDYVWLACTGIAVLEANGKLRLKNTGLGSLFIGQFSAWIRQI